MFFFCIFNNIENNGADSFRQDSLYYTMLGKYHVKLKKYKINLRENIVLNTNFKWYQVMVTKDTSLVKTSHQQ